MGINLTVFFYFCFSTKQIDSSTIDGKVEFAHSQYTYILTLINSVFVCDKIMKNSENILNKFVPILQ